MSITLTELGFLLRLAQNCQKYTFLDKLRTITQEGNVETRQMTPFFSSTFFALFETFIFVFENSQNSLLFGLPFSPFWSVKYPNFGQKLPIRIAHHTFLESRHPDLTKNLYCALSREGSQETISAHGLISQEISWPKSGLLRW